MLSQLRHRLKHPRVYDIQLTNQTPFAHLPHPYSNHRTLRFTRLEIANGQRYVIFQTLQAAANFIQIPLHFIRSLTQNVSGLILIAIPIPNWANPNPN